MSPDRAPRSAGRIPFQTLDILPALDDTGGMAPAPRKETTTATAENGEDIDAPAPGGVEELLNVLHIEDNPHDRELTRRQLEAQGFQLRIVYARDWHEFERALEHGAFDVILSDYSLPSFSGLEALSRAKETHPETPFILVSGTIGDEGAVEGMKAGATDYVLKKRLTSLGDIIRRAVREAKERKERQRAEQALRQSERQFASAFERAAIGMALFSIDGRWFKVNSALCAMFGYSEEELLGQRFEMVTLPEDLEENHRGLRALVEGESASFQMEKRYVRKSGQIIWGLLHVTLVRGARGEPRHFISQIQDITERKEAERALAASEAELRALFAALTDVVLVLDAEGRYLQIAPTSPSSRFRPPAMLIGRKLREFFPPEKADEFARLIRRALDERKTIPIEYSLPIEGATVWFEGSVSPMENDRVFWVARDVTPRRRLEADVAERELRLACFANLGRRLNATQGVEEAAHIIVDVADQLFSLDAFSLDLYDAKSELSHAILTLDIVEGRRQEGPPAYSGSPPSPMMRRTIREGPQLILREGPLAFGPELTPFGDTRRPSASILTAPIRNGQEVIGIVSIQSYSLNAYTTADRDALQALADHCGGALDRLTAEKARRESEERFRQLAENIDEVFWISTPSKDQILYVSPSYETIWGRSCESLYRSPATWLEAVHPEDRPRIQEASASQHTHLEYDESYRILRPDGSTRWIRDRAFPIRDSSGIVYRIVGVASDVTEQTLAAERIREQADLLNLTEEAITVRDLDERFLFWNRGAEKLYGVAAADALGKTAHQLFTPEPKASARAKARTLSEGSWKGDIAKITRDGRNIVVFSQWALVRDLWGAPKSFLLSESDVTDKRLMEARLLQSQRIESIGTLASGIAHDLNNILSPILLSAEILKSDPLDKSAAEMLETIHRSAQRGGEIVKQVLAFARGSAGRRTLLNPRHVLREVLNIVRETFPKTIRVNAFVPAQLPTIRANATELHQIFLNLCLNARDAMPEGGALSVRAEVLDADESHTAVHPDAQPGPHLVVAVSDTGVGISPTVLERIFDPFFTTKEMGKGTGLGLSTVLGIVKGYGGFIQIQSAPDQGATFRVWLPAAVNEESIAPSADAAAPPSGQGELVLVVDDEPRIREVTRQILTRYGYRVDLAANGADASAQIDRCGADVKLVLTDLMMPVMDGAALIHRLAKTRPDLPVIASSGKGAEALSEENPNRSELSGAAAFLAKPYETRELLATIHRLLNRERTGCDRAGNDREG